MMRATLLNQSLHFAPARFGRWRWAALAALVFGGRAFAQAPDAFNPKASSDVLAMAVQADGRVVVGGLFTNLAGQACGRIGRLNADGTLDSTLNQGAVGSGVYCLGIQEDGRIVVGGAFTTLAGGACTNLGRLNPDGSLDANFNRGANSNIFCFALQANGKILVGGQFTQLAGQSRTNLGRLNFDGTLDTNFNASAGGASAYVNALALQPDGKILVGGGFSSLNGQTRTNLGRLNADGTLDAAFTLGANGNVYSAAVQPDGEILVSGSFTRVAGQPRNYLARLNADGSLDTNFTASAGSSVECAVLQADGRILLGGSFLTLNGQSRPHLGRLNADGSLDATFNPGTDGTVEFVAPQSDGALLVGGAFKTLGGLARTNLGRLSASAAPTQMVAFDGSTLMWLRGGAAPEVWRTTLDTSTNGTDWVNHGDGLRTNGGWRWTGLAFAPNTTNIRTRGFVAVQEFNGSAWFVETFSTIGPLVIASQPASRTNNAGTSASFTVSATGTPFSYQWFKDAVPLSDLGNVSGSTTATLTLSNVLHADQAGYSVILSNTYGSVTSAVAALTVVDPFLSRQPVDQIVNVGQSAKFSVTVAGSAPLGFQWRHGGSNLTGASGSTLTVTNAQVADAGSYDVVVSNPFATRTSSVAVLTVNLAISDSFDPGPDSRVDSLAVQTDGRILAVGWFTNLAGQVRTNLARLNPDGAVDTNFNARLVQSATDAGQNTDSLGIQADGRILIGGGFNALGGQARTNLGRLNPDGTLDAAFSPGALGSSLGGVVGYGFPYANMAPQADGKILVWGSFTNLAGQPHGCIGRLNTNGTPDTPFNPVVMGPGFAFVYCAAQQPDGKILLGGLFTNLAGQARASLGRLNTDGTLDAGFNTTGVDGQVYCLALQGDGKVVVGGQFSTLNGQARANLGRLNADGSLDADFNPGAGAPGTTAFVACLAPQADGRILVGGKFTALGGQTRTNLGRLSGDGTVDPAFAPVTDNAVEVLAIQSDGRILVSGVFTNLAGQPRTGLGRVLNTALPTESLSSDGATITWLRGGTSPELWRASFDFSTNAGNWTSLAAPTRIPGGWQLAGVSLPPNTTIRARGYISEGYGNASNWFVETNTTLVQNPPTLPLILLSDGNFGVRSNQFGFNISGLPGQVVVTEASTNFMNWVPLATNSLGSAPVYFFDAAWSNYPARFYRLHLL